MLKSGKSKLLTALLAALLATFLVNPAFAEQLETLGPRSRGEKVATLKTDLKEKGYYTVKTDKTDTYTSALKSAVGVFQIANSIPAPEQGYGYADAETQIKAASDDAVYYSDYIQDKQLQPGGSGTYVKKAQAKLSKLGYYSGKANGKYSASTVVAVKYFEKANSLLEDGIADKETRDLLYSPDAKSRAQYEAENFLTPLKYGAKGPQVRQLQARLAELGFYWNEPTEQLDAQTRYGVKFFQEANGFKATGSVSKALRAKINDGPCVSFDEYAANMHLLQLSSGAKPGAKVAVLQRRLQDLGYYKGLITGAYTAPVIAAVRTFQTFNNLPSKYVTGKANLETRKRMLAEAAPLRYEDVCGDDTLKPGSTGEAVKSLQARLKALGYYNGELNGVYGSAVASAVKVFQQCSSLYPSGIAYTTTLSAIYDDKAASYTNLKIEYLIEEVAKKKLGKPYVRGASGPNAFDCSGFTSYCLRQVGIKVTSGVTNQAYVYRKGIGRRIDITGGKNLNELKRGDLLYFYTPISDKNPKPDTKKGPGHAGIYLGRNSKGNYQFIHASSGQSGKKVLVSDLKTYNERQHGPWFLWAIRIWE